MGRCGGGRAFSGGTWGFWYLEVIQSQKCFSETRAATAHWGSPFLEGPRKGCLRPSACRAPPWVFPPSVALWAGERLFSINNNEL